MAVCTALDGDADLLIKPADSDDLIVQLVVLVTEQEFDLKGWIPVRDGRLVGYRVGQNIFVPQPHLNDPPLPKVDTR